MEVVERSGIPAVGIFGEAFGPMARLLAGQIGIPEHRLAVYPGMMATDSQERLTSVARTILKDEVVRGFTFADGSNGKTANGSTAATTVDAAFAVVFRGSLDEVEDHFHRQGWSDGLPIIPPTADRVRAFLSHTDRLPTEVLGVLAPEKREATVMNVAVNGVMAGCRPAYMPILLAVVECITDPAFRIEDAGSTPGWEPLVVISGPLVQELEFNSGTGVMRAGRQANATVGRFVRMYMRNVAGLRTPPGVTDQAGFGANFNMALAENEDAVHRLGWQPYAVDRGFGDHDTVVTVQGLLNTSGPIYTEGDDPQDHLDGFVRGLERAWTMAFPAYKRSAGYQLLAMSPSIAQVFADHRVGKQQIIEYLVDHAYTDPKPFERAVDGLPLTMEGLIAINDSPDLRVPLSDPDKGLRIFLRDDWVGIVVSGNPGRNQSRGYSTNHAQGLPMSRRVVVPKGLAGQ
jgi:hypothetical protein